MTAIVKFIRRLFRLEVDEIDELDDDPQGELYFYDDVDPGTGFPLESDM